MNEKEEVLISPRQIANAISDLINENENLHQRIDKAIEYVEQIFTIPMSLNHYVLLEILKGEKNG